MARAAREIRRQRVLGAGDGPVADAVAVHVAVALELAQPFEVGGREHLAALDRRLGVRERIGEPEVHPEVKIAGDEDRGLKLLREVERLHGHRVAFADRAGNQDDVAAVAVTEQVELDNVSLAGASGQARARPHPLDVDDRDGDLGEIGEADELGHQRNARPGRRRERPCPGPARADRHADGRQLVLRLDHGEGSLAVGTDPVLFEELLGILRETARRGDRIPGQHAQSAEQRPERGGLVPLNEDLVLGRVDPFDPEGKVGGEVRLSPNEASGGGGDVDVGGLRLASGELTANARLDGLHLNPGGMCHNAHIHHVHDFTQLIAIRFILVVSRIGFLGQLGDRNGETADVIADAAEVDLVAVDHDRAGPQRTDVIDGCLRVHANEDFGVEPVADVPLGAGPDVEPGGQPLDVRWEDVLPTTGNAHAVQRAEDHEVCRLAPRPVHRADANRQLVHGRGRRRRGPVGDGLSLDHGR